LSYLATGTSHQIAIKADEEKTQGKENLLVAGWASSFSGTKRFLE